VGLRKRLGVLVIVVEAKFVGGGHASALSQLFRKQTAVVGNNEAIANGGIMMV
jgi:hypothetical protein